MKKKKDLSLSGQGLNYKLRIAFYLMSILPLLVSIYLVSNYILPKIGVKLDVIVSLIVSAFIAFTGFSLIKEVFNRILSVSGEAKLILAGDINRKIEVTYKDEVGDLGSALNELTNRIRGNMEELKDYGQKTTEINIEIQKRVLVLSSLLQINSLISQGAKLDDVLKLTVEKSRLLANSDLAFLLFRQEPPGAYFVRAADGVIPGNLMNRKFPEQEGSIKQLTAANRLLVLNKENEFGLQNALILPIFLRGKMPAAFVIGSNREGFSYKKDDLDLLDVFAKQVAVAIENDLLTHCVEKLEIKDALTGLYNEQFIRGRLDEEIKRAAMYQRPCAFLLLNIDNFQAFHQRFGALQAESVLKKVAGLLRESVITEVERVARFGDNEFAIVIPEKNKRQALEIAEKIRQKIEQAFIQEADPDKKLTASGSVSENPLDGTQAEELITKARSALNYAKIQGKNRIAV